MATDENGILPHQLAKLVVRVDGTADTAEDIIKATMREIRGELAVLAKELNLATSGKDREKAYAMIRAKMARLEKRLTALQQADLDYAGLAANRQAADDTGVKVQYSQKRADEISAIVSPMQGENLAAVFTQRMEKSIIQELRTATVATMREAAVAGMPMRDMARVLDERWQKAAKDGVALQFRDAAGKVWDTKTYMMMNTRTNAMRVYNDNLIDNIARATGSDLVMVSRGGDPHCKHCFPWEGRILSVSGKTKGFPTYDEARAAGLFHPNCTHTLEPVDELIDADEIELQRGVPSPDQVEDPLKQAFQLDVSTRKREDGLSDEQAALAVKRQWLKDAVRNGLPFEGSEDMIDGLTDAEVNALVEGDSGRVPAFEPTKGTKKNPDPQQFHAGSAGGVVHINRNNLTADALRELDGLKDRLEEARKQAEDDERKAKTEAFKPNLDALAYLEDDVEKAYNQIQDIIDEASVLREKNDDVCDKIIEDCADYSTLADIKAKAKNYKAVFVGSVQMIVDRRNSVLSLGGKGKQIAHPTDDDSQNEFNSNVLALRRKVAKDVAEAKKMRETLKAFVADAEKLAKDSEERIKAAKSVVEDERTRRAREGIEQYLDGKQQNLEKARKAIDGLKVSAEKALHKLSDGGVPHTAEKTKYEAQLAEAERKYVKVVDKIAAKRKELKEAVGYSAVSKVWENTSYMDVGTWNLEQAVDDLIKLCAEHEYTAREKARKAALPERSAEDKRLIAEIGTKVERGFASLPVEDVYQEAPHEVLDKFSRSLGGIREVSKDRRGDYTGGAYCSGNTIYLHAGGGWSGRAEVYLHESGHSALNLNGDYVGFTRDFKQYVTDKYKPILASVKKESDDLIVAIWGRDDTKRGKPPRYSRGNMDDLARHLGFDVKMKHMPLDQQHTFGALSDILEGATKAKCQCGVGHGAAYWSRGNRSVLHETVANITALICSDSAESVACRAAMPNTVRLVKQLVYEIQ